MEIRIKQIKFAACLLKIEEIKNLQILSPY